jgi:hypothetical protein
MSGVYKVQFYGRIRPLKNLASYIVMMVLAACTTSFNTNTIFFFSTDGINGSCITHRINSDYVRRDTTSDIIGM